MLFYAWKLWMSIYLPAKLMLLSTDKQIDYIRFYLIVHAHCFVCCTDLLQKHSFSNLILEIDCGALELYISLEKA